MGFAAMSAPPNHRQGEVWIVLLFFVVAGAAFGAGGLAFILLADRHVSPKPVAVFAVPDESSVEVVPVTHLGIE